MTETARDPLTGLETFASIETIGRGSALAFVDLRDFRERVNAPYGHDVGDHAIRSVAERLRAGLAPYRILRFGGAHFLVAIDGPLDEAGAADLARRIGDLVGQPIDGIAEPLEAWVGINLERVVDRALPVVLDAGRAAQVLAPKAGVPFVVVVGGTSTFDAQGSYVGQDDSVDRQPQARPMRVVFLSFAGAESRETSRAADWARLLRAAGFEVIDHERHISYDLIMTDIARCDVMVAIVLRNGSTWAAIEATSAGDGWNTAGSLAPDGPQRWAPKPVLFWQAPHDGSLPFTAMWYTSDLLARGRAERLPDDFEAAVARAVVVIRATGGSIPRA